MSGSRLPPDHVGPARIGAAGIVIGSDNDRVIITIAVKVARQIDGHTQVIRRCSSADQESIVGCHGVNGKIRTGRTGFSEDHVSSPGIAGTGITEAHPYYKILKSVAVEIASTTKSAAKLVTDFIA